MNASITNRLPRSTERVAIHTSDRIARKIERDMVVSVCYFQENPDEIDGRLDELSQEWDVERVLETNAATLTLTGLTFSTLFGKKWLLLSAAVSGFLLQHGAQGWCPPLPVLRKLGFRTRDEIRTEMLALRSIRGDFDDLSRARDLGSRELIGSVRRWRASDAAASERADADDERVSATQRVGASGEMDEHVEGPGERGAAERASDQDK